MALGYNFGDINKAADDIFETKFIGQENTEILYLNHEDLGQLHIEREEGENSQQSNPVVLLEQDKKCNINIKLDMGVYKNRTAYLSLYEHYYSDQQLLELYFDGNGRASLFLDKSPIHFKYPNGYWFKLGLNLDYQNDDISILVNDQLVSSNNNLSLPSQQREFTPQRAISFFPAYNNSNFLVENLQVKYSEE